MNVSLLLTTNRGLSPGTHLSLLQAIQQLGWSHSVIADGGLDRARGLLVTNWYQNTRDEAFFMVDDDMVFTPKQLLDLLEPGLDIVSAVYPTRHGESLTGLPVHPEEDHAAFSSGGLLELLSTGMGCVAIRRHVIEGMIKNTEPCEDGMGQWFWPLFLPVVQFGQYYQEDAAFSRRARFAGYKLWLHTAVRTTHLSTGFPINVDNLTQIRDANAALAAVKA